MQSVQHFLRFVHLIIITGFSGNCGQLGAFAAPAYLNPEIIPTTHNIDILDGADALMECKITGINIYHTVSWVRSSDIKVLTVGGLVFSSDPRMTVATTYTNNDTQATWSLRIRKSIERDSGEYKCQVNSEPAISASFRLIVRASNFGGNVEKKSSLVEMYVTDDKSESYIENEKNQQQSSGKVPTNFSEVNKSNNIQKSSMPIAAVMENNSTESKQATISEFYMSIIIPACSLIVIIVVVIVLGSMRVFFSWKLNPRGESRRSRSRSVTLERRRSSGSLRSLGSRRSRDSGNSNTSRRSRRKGREYERERDSIYNEISCNGRLPLQEIREPTQLINVKKPIFLIVRVDGLEKGKLNNFDTKLSLKKEIEKRDFDKLILSDIRCGANGELDETYTDIQNKMRDEKSYDKISVHSTDLQDIVECPEKHGIKALENGSSNNSSASLSQLSGGSQGSEYVETSKVISVQRYTI